MSFLRLSEVQIVPRHGGERDRTPAGGAPPPDLRGPANPNLWEPANTPAAEQLLRRRSSSSGGSSNGSPANSPAGVKLLRLQSLHTATIPISSMSRLNLYFRESKPKFLSPNSFSSMAEITPTTSLNLLWKYQRVGDPTQSLRFIRSVNFPLSSVAAQ